MEELLKESTKEQTLYLWGQPITNKHYLVEEIHGNGKQLVWFETMDSRPFHYLIRVDDSLDLDKEYWEILPKDSDCLFDEMLMRMIEDEYDNVDRYTENEEGLLFDPDDDTIEPFEGNWPMFSLGAGHSYGRVDIDELRRLTNKNK